MKKGILIGIIAFLLVIIAANSMYTVAENQSVCIFRFSEIVSTTDTAGLHFKIPFIDRAEKFTKATQLYDIPPSEVLTSDKKSMTVDCYILWSISDPQQFYRSLGTVAKAMAELSDEAANPVIMMNKATWGSFKAAAATNNYAYDPFEGLPVVFNNSITAFSAATTGVAYMIVGDLDHGALMNFPNGEDIEFKFDEMTLKKQDLIEVLGRQYVAIGVVAPNAFVKVTK